MEIHSVRIEHGPVQTPTMSYSQRQPPNHRPNHNQATQDIYKPSRSPLPPPTSSRYPYPTASPAQLPPQISNQQQQQRYVTSQQQQQQQPTSVANVFPTAAVAAAAAAAAAGYREYRTTPRISLLHPHEYARGGNSRDMQQPVGMHMEGQQHHHHQQQPIKKIRLQEHKEVIQPLRIDTREQPGTYNPQVEAISPTLPDHLQQEEQTFRTTKDELIQQIGKVDREIAKAESQITILKKIEKDLEEIASKPSVKDEVDPEDAAQPLKHQSLPQKIYAENRKKAQSAHAKLDALGPKVEWPLYNQPSDTAIYHENKRKHMAFKKRLLEYFKRRHVEKDTRNGYLTETYSKLMQEWVRKVEKIENTTKRKAKEAKNREFFEKVFPELRKQREDKERFNRVGARVKSEADMEEIMDNLQEQAMEDKKMRSYAVIPPILLDAKERKLTYQDNNGYIDDMEHVYKSRQFLNIWTPSEKEIFKEKYLQHPKNFGVIASFIERKTVADCVQYYYLSKKTENYKQLLRKSRQRTRSSRNNSQKVTSANNASVVDILTTGVTTRLQREQQQQRTVGQQQQQQSSSSTSSSSSTRNDVVTTSTTSSSTTTDGGGGGGNYSSASNNQSLTTNNCLASGIVVTSSSGCNNNNNNNNNVSAPKSPQQQQQQQQKSSSSSDGSGANNNNNTSDTNNKCDFVNNVNVATTTSAAVATPTIGSDEFKPKFFGDDSTNKLETTQAGGEQQQQQHDLVEVKKEDINQDVSDQTSSSTSISENKKKKERRKDKENANVETSDDENLEIQDKSIQGICIVCNAQLGPHLQSRPLVPSQATQYGLHEDQIPANGRVCNTCRCKCVRSRYTHCPLPTCPNSRGRVKRLRSFPQRFQDLPNDLREPLLAEFHISSGITKCCSACFNRIQRRLGPPEEWSEDEVQQLKIALTDLGANWSAIGERLNKSAQQIRAFYSANRKRFNLEICLGDRKPTLTDEEESGSSTSSCEEAAAAAAAAAVQTQLLRNTNSAGSSSTTSSTGGGGNADRHSSDTASAAESPPNLAAVQQQTGNSCAIKKEDYDSSATETADEAQTTPDHYQGSATITPVTTDGQPKQNASPLSVKDLVLNVIEFQLMKNPGAQLQANATQPTTSGMAPTISSILNNDSNEVTIVSEYNLNSQQQQQQQQVRQRNDLNLAKLVTPLIGATITPVPAVTQPPPSSHHAIQQQQDDLVVLQVPETGSHQPETLDLSIKKPREMREMMPSHNKQQHRGGGGEYLQHSYHERKSPAFSSIRPQPKLPSPKPANLKSGSITLGTPMLNQPRYEGLLRQMPADAKMGSITQGTPIHLPSQQQQQHMQEKRAYEFYKRSGGQSNQQNQQQQQNYQYRQPAYNVEQQIQSRQIIMNDYITSQQMISRRNEKSYYQANSPVHRTPPPNHQQQQNSALVANQQRQGVIQRHNTRPQYLPPGHEALSSLVDVAVQQPSLPVPPNAPHEGLGKTMADNIMEQPHRFQVLQQHQQQQIRQQQQQQQHVQQRLMEEHQRRIVYQQNSSVRQQQQHQQQQRNNSEGSTSLTAASLIDAIITHQINQTSEGGREMITNQREPRAGDLLFQSFHPPQQQQQQQQAQENNGEAAASSVISIDLDAEPAASSGTINKNLTVKELTDSVISHDFSTRQPSNYYLQQQEEQWKRRLKEDKRAGTPQQDERQIIRIAQSQQQQQQQKFHVEPVSPPDNHWSDQQQQQQSFRRYPQSVPAAAAVAAQQQQQNQHMSPLDYVKNRIVEVMRTEDDKKEDEGGKERSDSPGEMVIDEDKHEEQQQQRSGSVEQQGFGGYSFIQQHNDSTANDARNNEPKPLLSAQYEPLSDED